MTICPFGAQDICGSHHAGRRMVMLFVPTGPQNAPLQKQEVPAWFMVYHLFRDRAWKGFRKNHFCGTVLQQREYERFRRHVLTGL